MKKEITCFEAPKIMEKALDVGEAMLCTGAEISRVEDKSRNERNPYLQ